MENKDVFEVTNFSEDAINIQRTLHHLTDDEILSLDYMMKQNMKFFTIDSDELIESLIAESARNGGESVDADYRGKWAYWSCLPGCLPDSDIFGPFDTLKDAIRDCENLFFD